MMKIAVPFRDYAAADATPASGKPLGMSGRYIYHCHILEHEDHEMMRPYVVMPPEVIDHMHAKGGHMAHAGATTTTDGDAAADGASAGWYMEPDLCCCDDKPQMPHG